MKLGLHQSARMEQRLVQSPQMIQAMQILQLSSLDLEERVEQEMVENPFLEVVEPEPTEEDGAAAPPDTERQPEPDPGLERMVEELERYERDFGDGRSRAARSEDSDRKLEAMQNTAAPFRSQADDLIEQLAILDLDERQRSLAEFVIYSLDERGFLTESLEEIAGECDSDPTELEGVLAELRRIAHPALGARDLRECLLLQLAAHGLADQLEGIIVRDHIDDLITNRLPRIARATEADMEIVKDAIDTIRCLDPYPGRGFGNDPATAINPEVVVELVDDRYEVRLTRGRVPELHVSPSYRQLLQGTQRGDAVQQWVKRRIESARWFIDAIHQRQNTMLKIAEEIFAHQRVFLDEGVSGLRPLRMQEVADKVGVHISTVSRAVAGKYAQTPQGIHPLKYFFTGGTAVDSGGVASQASVKQRIADLVAAEDPKKPLSDDQLADLLHESDGIRIARRTVTKYRKALAIPASSQRKQF